LTATSALLLALSPQTRCGSISTSTACRGLRSTEASRASCQVADLAVDYRVPLGSLL